MKRPFILLIVFLLPFFLVGKDNPPQERNFRLFHFSADLYLNPVTQLLQGSVTFDISMIRTQTDSLVFYTPGINISAVSLKSYTGKEAFKPIRFQQVKDNLILYPEREIPFTVLQEPQITLKIDYSATSSRELHFVGWDDKTGRMRKQVWAHRPFGWIPYTDQMTTQDIRITFNRNYLVVSNGERISKTVSGDTAFTWHYRLDKPHPFYSVCLVAGDYAYKNLKTSRGVPLELWYYPDMADRFETTYRLQEEMFDFFEWETGFPYPYALYRNLPVADYLYGAMETTTSTVYADFMLVDPRGFLGRNFINTNAHELAHQWFGNCINDKTVNDLWLTESFATYYAKIFERKYMGEEQYEYQRDTERQKAMKIAETNNYPLGSGKAGSERWYQKGSLVMDMLRDVIGNEAFMAAIQYYLQHQAYGEAESNDFLKAIYNTSGQALDWFFDDWIYGGGEPEYKISWKNVKNADNQLITQVTVEQVQLVNSTSGLFRIPVTIETYDPDHQCVPKTIWIEKPVTVVEIPVSKLTSFVVFDAGNRILKKMQFTRQFDELASQAEFAHHMADRLEAVRSLQNFPVSQKREVLTRIFKKDSFHLIRTEIVNQLAVDSLSYGLMKKAMHDPQVLVRKAVTDYITIIPVPLQAEYETLLKDSAYFIVESALVNLCNTNRDNSLVIEKYLALTSRETGWRGRNIRVAWLGIAAYIHPEKKEYLEELIDYAGPSFDFETRTNALNELKKLDYLDEKSAGYLLAAAAYWNYKLSGPAKELVTYFQQQKRYIPLLEKTGK
ncbi:MAG: M1 family aminopeptidase [Bacteroidetes bacterium]|nr:M1 family aminopeptidase [Bacteroidota bacterium]